jgi:formylglycine-generating enzyme required for sulfatase activity
MSEPKRPLKVFLSHAHADREAVRALYARLKREGVDVWLDKEKLLPGADWELEIRKAVRESDVVVVCLSNQFNQAGFRQKEVRLALDTAMEKPEGEIFIIPARLEECDVPESLSKWHWVDLFESDGIQRLILALRVRADKIGAALRQRGHAAVSRPKNTAGQEAARLQAAEERERQIAAQAERETAERIAREKAEREAARLEAEELARQKAAKERKDRETAERLAQERLAREAREKAKKAKPPRKPNTAIIVAIIGLIGTICAALISSPMLANLFSRTPEPTAIVSTPTPSLTPTKTLTPTPTRTPTPTPYPTQITDAKGIPMRLVPAGEFTMGSKAEDTLAECQKYYNNCQLDWFKDEEPPHQVYLDAFYMDMYEVTNAAYRACVSAGVCTPPHDTRFIYYGNSQYDNYPVIYVDWEQAKTYCEWRGGSLPTEAQWEKAARGTDGRTYPWGEGISCNRANYYGCKGDTTEVGSYESGKSPYGIYDLAGNVWEWVADWYDPNYYAHSPSSNPLGPSSGQYRVLRGGSWSDYDFNVRSANRYIDTPVNFISIVGFRCARSISP